MLTELPRAAVVAGFAILVLRPDSPTSTRPPTTRLRQAAEAGDWSAARDEQNRIARLFDIAFVPQGRSGDAGGIGAFKAALALLGVIDSAAMPAPLEGLSDDDTASIREILAEVGLLQ